MPDEKIETLVIGGGQAGLVMSHRLKERGLSHLVLERHRIAERWRSERWDGLKFQFPNWSVRLPDFPFPHSDPDAFSNTDDIIRYIEAYAGFVAPPIRCGVAVTRLSQRDGAGFIAETTEGTVAADNVVVATGPYQRNLVPTCWAIIRVPGPCRRLQESRTASARCGAGRRRRPRPARRCRGIAAGRPPRLSLGRTAPPPAAPYRGRDLIWWLADMRLDQSRRKSAGPRASALSFRRLWRPHHRLPQFRRDGMILVGRIEAAHHGVLEIAPGLAESLADGDLVYTTFLDTVDAYVKRRRLELPEDPDARATFADPPCVTAPLTHLDLAAEGISAVIWATGYGVDFGWIDLPVTDAKGEAIHRNGVSAVPGLYFLGLQWLSKMNSSFLSGVGDDAAVLADHILARR